jgi:virginiamycin B lyase
MRRRRFSAALVVLALSAGAAMGAEMEFSIREYRVPAGSHPHDIAPAPDGSVWYTAQHTGELGRLDPRTGRMDVFDAPGGRGPYGIASTPEGGIYYVSLAGSYMARIDTAKGTFRTFPLPSEGTRVRQLLGRKGEVWGAESGVDRLVVIRFR